MSSAWRSNGRSTSDAFTLVFADALTAPVPTPAPDAAGIAVWRDADDRLVAWGQSDAAGHWMHWPGLASFRFGDGVGAMTAYPAPGARPEFVRDTWLRSIVPMALQALGREALHASAVLGTHGVVAFCAQSQTGKSTLAYGLARRGYRQWADDAVVLEMEGAAPIAVALPFHVRLRPASANFYGASEIAENTPGVVSAPGVAFAPLAAGCILRRHPPGADAGVTIERLQSAAAFVALLTHAYCFDPADAARKSAMLQHYLDMAAAIPVFQLTFPTDLERMNEVLDAAEALVERVATGNDEASAPVSRHSNRELANPPARGGE